MKTNQSSGGIFAVPLELVHFSVTFIGFFSVVFLNVNELNLCRCTFKISFLSLPNKNNGRSFIALACMFVFLLWRYSDLNAIISESYHSTFFPFARRKHMK